LSLHAADAATLLVEAAEAGGTAVVGVVVAASRGDLTGRRIAMVVSPEGGSSTHGSLGDATMDRAAEEVFRKMLAEPRAGDGIHSLGDDSDPVELYTEIRRPVQELVVVGAGHIAQPLTHIGSLLGFRVIVIDDRPDFATTERFPDAERVLSVDFDDPFADVQLHERSHVLLVTRGHKYDYACLVRALRMEPAPAYIGMIGSRRRVRATYVQLIEDGMDRALLDRIHAPVGLDIGAETPEEIAVAVAAELVLVRRGGSGTMLKELERVAERFFGDEDPA
jgi:xanthine dehydrogenase accessory factor